jgi:hypothetical protein
MKGMMAVTTVYLYRHSLLYLYLRSIKDQSDPHEDDASCTKYAKRMWMKN